MSFSTKVKEEIGKHGSAGRHCQIAELLALVLTTGEVELKNSQVKLILKLENELIADKICELIHKLFDKKVMFERHSKYIEIDDQNMIDLLLQTIKLSDYVDYLEEDWLEEEELQIIDENADMYVFSKGVSVAKL